MIFSSTDIHALCDGNGRRETTTVQGLRTSQRQPKKRSRNMHPCRTSRTYKIIPILTQHSNTYPPTHPESRHQNKRDKGSRYPYRVHLIDIRRRLAIADHDLQARVCGLITYLVVPQRPAPSSQLQSKSFLPGIEIIW